MINGVSVPKYKGHLCQLKCIKLLLIIGFVIFFIIMLRKSKMSLYPVFLKYILDMSHCYMFIFNSDSSVWCS